ncbi:MAG TPA: NAD-dependent epimerase/dehydratase family protein [Baekduia sp.]|uniref:NAD-dependent epimerase/dehydratase family protein n=1 Tax=Baekduia sp. TaxID=2600305 RepID=UPI002C34182F|nr:NAD-dependent epimerase/dehydratase family protein [Baekduia sp.]HMJ35068.1 NAD-dependent epimerase/dehydratase family protein [Baekduia sp.]
MRVAIVGATGNVGSALLRALGRDERVREIVGIARRRPQGPPPPKVTWAVADVARDDLAPALTGADVVVHLAWLIQPDRHPEAMEAVNVGGSRRVFEATLRAGAGTLVVASSVGVYSPGPKDRAVDESWPREGIPTSTYSQHKAQVERMLDALEAEHPHVRVARLRPGLIFQRDAASEIRRYFLGPLVPNPLLRRALLPMVPRTDRLSFQAVHADDVADAYCRVIAQRDVGGAFNLAAEPLMDSEEMARVLHARPVPVPARVLRTAADLTWRAHLQPTSPGWIDLARGIPVMATTRARSELGWTPRHSASEALLELLDGLGHGAGGPTPPLDPHAGGRFRRHELARGIGSRP